MVNFAVGDKVERCQSCIHQVREDIQHNRGKLAMKMNKLADGEAEMQIFQIRKDILTSQRDTLFEAKRIDSLKAVRKFTSLYIISLYSPVLFNPPS